MNNINIIPFCKDNGHKILPDNHCAYCNEKIYTCPVCEELFTEQEWDNAQYANITDQMICEGCYEQDTMYPSTLIRFNGEKEVVRFGDHIAMTDDGEEPPQWFLDIFTERTYVNSGGYRGYYDTKFKGLVSLAEGWVTGYPDETTQYKRKSEKFIDFLNNVYSPKYIYWLFEPTSNVFSTATELLVEERDKEEIEEWLEKHKFSIESLQQAFE